MLHRLRHASWVWILNVHTSHSYTRPHHQRFVLSPADSSSAPKARLRLVPKIIFRCEAPTTQHCLGTWYAGEPGRWSGLVQIKRGRFRSSWRFDEHVGHWGPLR